MGLAFDHSRSLSVETLEAGFSLQHFLKLSKAFFERDLDYWRFGLWKCFEWREFLIRRGISYVNTAVFMHQKRILHTHPAMTGDKARTRTIRDNELVSANNPFPEIPVTVPQIIRQAGHRTYQRGVAYQRNREVIRYSYDEDNSTLTGLVNGSTIIPYEVTIRFFPAVSGSATFTARCTCPVLTDCKHAVALMLTALDRASVAKKALSEHPGPVGVPGAAAKGATDAKGSVVKGSADSKSADVAEAKKAADPLAALRASGALTTAAKLPAPDVAAAEPGNPQGSFALNELGTSPSLQAEASTTKISAWRRDLSSVLSARQDLAGIDSMRVSGALDFSLSVSGSYARGRNMPGATPSINLLARPLMASKTGRWIKGGLSWETFASSVGGPVGRHEIYPEHERFFAELYSIARPWQNMYSSHRDWISISASASTLLWDVLARAEDIGLPLLVNGREVNYAVLSPAQVRLHAAAAEDTPGEGAGLQLQAALSWEGREGELLRQLWLPAAHCHPIGTPRTGFFALGGLAQQEYEQAAKAVHWKTARPGALDEVGRESFVHKTAPKDAREVPAEPSAPTLNPAQGERVRYSPAVPELPEGVELALIPLVEPLDAASESLISAGTVHIPAAERATFQKEYLPALSRSIPSLTPDPALALPRVKPPHLVLEISFDEQVRHDAQLSWRWEYPLNPFAEDSAEEASAQDSAGASDVYSLPVFGYPGEEGGEIRDERFEARVLRSVRAILAAHPALSGLEERRIEGWETRELLSAILPKLRRVSAVQVRFNGTPPQFVEATDALIEITVSEGNSRDWFGLGIAVKVNNWTVPFAQIFEALDRGADRILLGNGTYFSLRRPEFKTLRTLIAEARELDDAGGELRINRHQAGLFSELESLAASVHTTARWDAQVRSLLQLVEGLEVAEESTEESTKKGTEKVSDKGTQDSPAPQKASCQVIAQRPVPAGLQATLRPYQVEGFQWLSFLYEQRLGGILADDMGLGKTVQALALLAHAIEEHRAASTRAASERAASEDATECGESVEPFAPFLVVAPTSVITNWAAEAARFLPEAKVVTVTETTAGKTPLAERIAGAHLVLTSYTLLRMDEDAYTGYARTLGRTVDERTVDESTGELSAP